MIGKRPALGTVFKGLQQYLLHGRNGTVPDRAVWASPRNLPAGDLERTAALMQATAKSSTRVEKPVYHLIVSMAPGERLGREQLERVADRLLADLGLGDHQALVAEHADRAQQHVHIMVNRVHPDTGLAWKPSHDYARIERSLRAQERELGLRVVPGRHVVARERGRHHGTQVSRPPFAAEVRDRIGDALGRARDWQGLHADLSREGLAIRPGRSGRGLVVTDGRRYVAASKVARSASRPAMEMRLGPYEAPSRQLDALRDISREIQRRGRLDALRVRCQAGLRDLDAALGGHQRAAKRHGAASTELDKLLRRAYADPQRARRQIEGDLARERGREVARTLREAPERYGTLRGHAVFAHRERTAARAVLATHGPRAVRDLVAARAARQVSEERLGRFRANDRHRLVPAAERARRSLQNALTRLHRIDRGLAPADDLHLKARDLVQGFVRRHGARVAWRTIGRLVPHPAVQALRLASTVTRAPVRVLDRGLER